MKSALDPVLVEIMGASGIDPEHCLALAGKLEKWAQELRQHAETVSTVSTSRVPARLNRPWDPQAGFSQN